MLLSSDRDGYVNGREAAIGTYFWMVRLKGPVSGTQRVFRGDVTLIR